MDTFTVFAGELFELTRIPFALDVDSIGLDDDEPLLERESDPFAADFVASHSMSPETVSENSAGDPVLGIGSGILAIVSIVIESKQLAGDSIEIVSKRNGFVVVVVVKMSLSQFV